MDKFPKELIINYINGNDIKDYTIEELESNKDFMMQVIDYSNDKNIYNLCADNVKRDYDFVKFIILKFKEDINFITMVADYFLEDKNRNYERIELSIIMSELTKKDPETAYYYNVLCGAIYLEKRARIEICKSENEELSDIGMGFFYIYELYNQSEIILDYYAKRMIEDIFDENNLNLESILHKTFKTPDEINKKGLNNYMISFIEKYDSMLAQYVTIHKKILLPFKERIISAQKNWDRYNDEITRKKYELMFERVHKYMDEEDSLFSEDYLIYYVGTKLGIVDYIRKYDYVDNETSDYIIKDLSSEFVKKNIQASFVDRLHYKRIKEIMMSTLFDRKVPRKDRKRKKVLSIKFNNSY